MKNLAKRIGLLLVSGLVMHGSILACSDGDSETTACAGPGTGGAGGSGVSTTATGSAPTSGSGSATTGSTSAASSTSAAGSTSASSSSASTGSGGSNACGCAQPMTYDIQAADFQSLPAGAQFPTCVVALKVPGRDIVSMLGTTAYGVPVANADPLGIGADVPYKPVDVYYRDGAVVVLCGAVGAGSSSPIYKSVRFIVPPAP